MPTLASHPGAQNGAEDSSASLGRKRDFFEHAPFGVFLLAEKERIVYVNVKLLEMLGKRQEAAIRLSLSDLFSPEECEALKAHALLAVSHQTAVRGEADLRLRRTDESCIRVRVRFWTVREAEDEPQLLAVQVEEPCDGEDQEERNGRRLRQMVEELHSMVWMTDAQGNINFLNKASRTFCGVGDEETWKAAPLLFTRPECAPEYAAEFERAVKEQNNFSAEVQIQLANGEWKILGTKAQPSFLPSGEYIGHIGLSADITERRAFEQAREFEFTLFQSILQGTLEGVLVVDGDGRIASLNQRFLDVNGIPITVCPGNQLANMIGREDQELLSIALEQIADPDTFLKRVRDLYGNPQEEDHREVAMKDGRTIERRSIGLWSRDGKYLGRVCFCRDITAHKQAELNLRRAKTAADEATRRLLAKSLILGKERRMLRALIDNIPDFMYVKDVSGKFVLANVSITRAVGFNTPEEIIGKTAFDLFPSELAKSFHEIDLAVLETGSPVFDQEKSYLDLDGEETHILMTKVPIRDDKNKITGIACVGKDITARKEYADALRQAEQKYRGIFDNAIFGIFQSTPQGKYLSVNSSMAAMFGYASPEEMTSSIADIATQIYADSKSRTHFIAQVNSSGSAQNYEFEGLRKDGGKIWISMSVRAISQDGDVLWYEGMCEDITERKLLRDQLFQAQKLESVGQLAAGIAHEINTPTQYIGDNVHFLKDAFGDLKELLSDHERLLQAAQESDWNQEACRQVAVTAERVDAPYLLEEVPRAVEQALEGVTRVSALVAAMKDFSHPGTKEKVMFDLNHAIASTVTVTRNEWKYVADLNTEFDPALPQVPCLPAEFNQVILNLIVNSAHAIADALRQSGSSKGRIIVQTKNCQQYAEIRVQDTGLGIPEKIRDRVFDPFFTTKEIGKGTGQGLAIARSVIVDKLGGTIHFETQEGEGTTFIIRLPYHGALQAGKTVQF